MVQYIKNIFSHGSKVQPWSQPIIKGSVALVLCSSLSQHSKCANVIQPFLSHVWNTGFQGINAKKLWHTDYWHSVNNLLYLFSKPSLFSSLSIHENEVSLVINMEKNISDPHSSWLPFSIELVFHICSILLVTVVVVV